jgi:hypothetical protein
MNPPTVRVLRVSGLPPEMASRAIDAVLGTDRDVLAIDTIEPGPEDPQSHVLHVLVEGSALERVRRKLVTGFSFVGVEDVTDSDAAARSPSVRIRAAAVCSDPLRLALETRKGEPFSRAHPTAA